MKNNQRVFVNLHSVTRLLALAIFDSLFEFLDFFCRNMSAITLSYIIQCKTFFDCLAV